MLVLLYKKQFFELLYNSEQYQRCHSCWLEVSVAGNFHSAFWCIAIITKYVVQKSRAKVLWTLKMLTVSMLSNGVWDLYLTFVCSTEIVFHGWRPDIYQESKTWCDRMCDG
jgi:hypothetical protein